MKTRHNKKQHKPHNKWYNNNDVRNKHNKKDKKYDTRKNDTHKTTTQAKQDKKKRHDTNITYYKLIQDIDTRNYKRFVDKGMNDTRNDNRQNT